MEYGYSNAWNLSDEDVNRLRESGDYDEASAESGASAEGVARPASPDVVAGKASLNEASLVLYFLPQSYFYYGLVISGLTLSALISLLVREWWRERVKR